MVRARREIEEERLVRGDLLEVGDEADRLVGEVRGQMVALFRGFRRLDLMIVVDEVGIILMRVAAEKAVIALEAAPERPSVIGAGGADLFGRRQVPLADAVGGVALLQQHFGQKPVLERDRAIAAGIAGRSFGDAGHRIGVMIAAGQHAGPRGRTERRGMHVGEEQAVLGQPVDVGRVDRRAVAAELSEAGVVDDDEKDVRRAFPGAERGRPRRIGLADGAAHAAGKRRAGFVFLERHVASSSSSMDVLSMLRR